MAVSEVVSSSSATPPPSSSSSGAPSTPPAVRFGQVVRITAVGQASVNFAGLDSGRLYSNGASTAPAGTRDGAAASDGDQSAAPTASMTEVQVPTLPAAIVHGPNSLMARRREKLQRATTDTALAQKVPPRAVAVDVGDRVVDAGVASPPSSSASPRRSRFNSVPARLSAVAGVFTSGVRRKRGESLHVQALEKQQQQQQQQPDEGKGEDEHK